MNNNIFSFADTYWHQLSGTAMGTPTACAYATITYGHFKNSEILPRFNNNLLYYKRYIDDIFGIWIPSADKNPDSWPQFKALLNTWGNLKWQIEEKFITCYSKLLSDHRDNQPINTTKTTDDKAVLSLDTAIRFINRYCIRLPSDALTQLTPRQLTIARRQDNGPDEFKCLIYLPINSGVRHSIESEWRPSASLAQRSAAFRGCLLLSRQKELNDMLEPVTKEMFYRISHKSDADDEREWTQFSSYFQRHQQQAGAQSLSSLQQQISSYMAHRPGGVKRRQVVRKLFSGLYLKSFQDE